MFLKWIKRQVEDFLGCMDWVHDNNNLGDIVIGGCLIDTASDSEEFSLHTCYVDSMVKCFYNRIVTNINVCNRYSHIVLDASICDNKSRRWIVWRFKGYFVKFLNPRLDIMANALVKEMERKAISMSINDSITRRKLWVNRIKRWKNLIKTIIYVNYIAFDKTLLSSH